MVSMKLAAYICLSRRLPSHRHFLVACVRRICVGCCGHGFRDLHHASTSAPMFSLWKGMSKRFCPFGKKNQWPLIPTGEPFKGRGNGSGLKPPAVAVAVADEISVHKVLATAIGLTGLVLHVYFDYKNEKFQQTVYEYHTERLSHIKEKNEAIKSIAESCTTGIGLLYQMSDARISDAVAAAKDPPAAP